MFLCSTVHYVCFWGTLHNRQYSPGQIFKIACPSFWSWGKIYSKDMVWTLPILAHGLQTAVEGLFLREYMQWLHCVKQHVQPQNDVNILWRFDATVNVRQNYRCDVCKPQVIMLASEMKCFNKSESDTELWNYFCGTPPKVPQPTEEYVSMVPEGFWQW